MAEFLDVVKIAQRICKAQEDCVLCPLYNASTRLCEWITADVPEEHFVNFEKIVVEWAEKHKKTNADKFREVFGVDVENCSIDFWDMLYMEEKENG